MWGAFTSDPLDKLLCLFLKSTYAHLQKYVHPGNIPSLIWSANEHQNPCTRSAAYKTIGGGGRGV